jgi:hypothetical protein
MPWYLLLRKSFAPRVCSAIRRPNCWRAPWATFRRRRPVPVRWQRNRRAPAQCADSRGVSVLRHGALIRSKSPERRACRTGLSCLRFLFHLHSPTGHYDEPEILSYAMPLVCSIGADVRHNLRVVVAQTNEIDENTLATPVHILDVDYAHLRFKTYRMGGVAYFDKEIEQFPSKKNKCHRLD